MPDFTAYQSFVLRRLGVTEPDADLLQRIRSRYVLGVPAWFTAKVEGERLTTQATPRTIA